MYYRRTAPQVKDGRVQRKQRHELTPSYWNTPQLVPVTDRERPGRGYRHLLNKQHIKEFAAIVPEWDQLAAGLDAIVLVRGEDGVDGWYDNGVIGICAWEREVAVTRLSDYVEEHGELLARLCVECRPGADSDETYCCFTESTARAFQLLHILLHELGHHRDYVEDPHRRAVLRFGESFAEKWAYRYEKLVWQRYLETFGLHW